MKNPASGGQPPYETFADQAFVTLFRETPEIVTLMGLSGLPEFAGINDKLNDYSVDGVRRRGQLLVQLRRAHTAYDRNALTAAEQLSFDVFTFFLDYLPFEPWVGAAGADFAFHSYSVRHIDGAPNDTLNLLANFHAIGDGDDAEAYLRRLQQLGPMFADLKDDLQYRHSLNLAPPSSALAIVISEIQALLDGGVDDSHLLRTFAAKMAACDAIDTQAQQRYLQQAQQLVQRLYQGPLADFLESLIELQRSAAQDIGVWRLPDGDAYYQFALERQLSMTMTPNELFALGADEVQRLHSELADDLRALGVRAAPQDSADLAAGLASVLREQGAAAQDTLERRQEIVDYYSQLVAVTGAKMRSHFGRYPQAGCIVKPTERYLEKQRTTVYYPPSITGDYAGLFELSLPQELNKPTWSRNTLAYHEAFPGHHLQLSLAQELEHLPLFRHAFVNAGYLEGWAKYAERLPFETGLDTDPRYELQRKAQELISASNVMLDVGIHQQRWSREKAIAFSREQALVNDSMAAYLVDRISVTPGQVTAYSLGLSRVRALRRKMQQARGDAFRLADFHDQILLEGALPLELLETRFESFLSAD